VLDEILGNQTDVPITEHAADTHSASLINFALFDLVGLQLSPRIRDLGKITLGRFGSRSETGAAYPKAGPLLTRRINTTLIADQWDEMLRLAASLKYGHVTASLIVGKLSRVDRQNTLATALKEYGLLRRTIYAGRYLSREDYRRKILANPTYEAWGGTLVGSERTWAPVRVFSAVTPGGPPTSQWGNVDRIVYDHPTEGYDLTIDEVRRGGTVRLPTLASAEYSGREYLG